MNKGAPLDAALAPTLTRTGGFRGAREAAGDGDPPPDAAPEGDAAAALAGVDAAAEADAADAAGLAAGEIGLDAAAADAGEAGGAAADETGEAAGAAAPPHDANSSPLAINDTMRAFTINPPAPSVAR